MSNASGLAGGERLRAAAEATASTKPGSVAGRAARLELFEAIRAGLGADLARWSRRLAVTMEPDECAAELWAQLLERPGEVRRLADQATLDPYAALWSAAAHEPKNGGQRPPGWLFVVGGGYDASRTPLEEWDEPANQDTDPYTLLDEDTLLTRVGVVVERILEVVLPRTPEGLRVPVTEGVRWMALRRIQWRNATAYVREAVEACAGLDEDQVRTLVGVVWGSNKRPDMSLFNLFRWDAAAAVVDHGAAYRSACLYRERISGWKKRQPGRAVVAGSRGMASVEV